MFYKFFHCPEGLVMRPTLPKWYLMIINLLNLIKCYINLPNKISYHYSQTILIISLLCDTNIVLNCYLTTFFNESMMKNNKKKWRRNVQFMLLEQILAWWQCSLASREEKFSSIGLCVVRYWRTSMAIKTVSEVGTFIHFVYSHPGGRRGNSYYLSNGNIQGHLYICPHSWFIACT